MKKKVFNRKWQDKQGLKSAIDEESINTQECSSPV